MENITHQRCSNHALREAAAICLECDRYFCRECVTEHEGKVVCTSCLRKLAVPSLIKRLHIIWLVRAGQCLLGIVCVWLFFYCMGRILLLIPSSFHEGTLWKTSWRENL